MFLQSFYQCLSSLFLSPALSSAEEGLLWRWLRPRLLFYCWGRQARVAACLSFSILTECGIETRETARKEETWPWGANKRKN